MDVWEAGERARQVELMPCEHEGLSLIPRTVRKQAYLACLESQVWGSRDWQTNGISDFQVPVTDPGSKTQGGASTCMYTHVHMFLHTGVHTQTWKKKTDVSILCPKTTVYRTLLFMQEVRPSCHYSTIMDLKIQQLHSFLINFFSFSYIYSCVYVSLCISVTVYTYICN